MLQISAAPSCSAAMRTSSGDADHQPGAQARDPRRRELRMPQHRAGDARQRVGGGAAVPLDQPDPFAGIEPPLQHQRRAVRQGRGQGVAGAVSPEQRRRQQHAVLRPETHSLADVEPVLDDGVVLEPHRFRSRARPRGVEDQRVVGRARPVAGRKRAERRRRRGNRHRRSSPAGSRRRASRQGEGADNPARFRRWDRRNPGRRRRSIAISAADFGIGEQIGEFGRFRPGAERHRNGPERRRAESRIRAIRAGC